MIKQVISGKFSRFTKLSPKMKTRAKQVQIDPSTYSGLYGI